MAAMVAILKIYFSLLLLNPKPIDFKQYEASGWRVDQK